MRCIDSYRNASDSYYMISEAVMEVGQELVLLRDAMLSAVHRRRYSFLSEEDAVSSAALIKETADAVVGMMKIDEQTEDDIKSAQKSMHLAIFYKVLQSAGMLLDPDEHRDRLCASFPDIGWPTYIRASALCDWYEFVDECLSTLKMPLLADVLESILKTFPALNVVSTLNVWCWVVRNVMKIVLSGEVEDADLVDSLLTSSLNIKCFSELDNLRAKVIVELFIWFCTTLCQYSACDLEKNLAISLVVDKMLFTTQKHFFSSSVSELKLLITECYFTVKNLHDGFEKTGWKVAHDLKVWMDVVVKLPQMSDIKEDRIVMDMKLIGNSTKSYQADAIDRLIEQLEENVDERVVQCLDSNCHKLQQQHVFRLLDISWTMFDGVDHGLKEICLKAFGSWCLEDQDAFRGEFHTRYDLKLTAYCFSDLMENDLTTAFNRLSSSNGTDQSIISDMSLMCWNAPMETVQRVLDHAVRNGQVQIAIKIFVHLRRSCCATVSPHNLSLINFNLKTYLVENDFQTNQWNNYVSLLKDLLKEDICNTNEFLDNVIMEYLLPSPHCYRVLQALQVFLEHLSAEPAKISFDKNVTITVLFLVSQVLDDCMSRYTSLPYEVVAWDVIELKREAIAALSLAIRLYNQHVFLQKDLLCLRHRVADFHPLLHFYLHDVIFESDTLVDCYARHDVSAWFETLTLDELLFAISTSTDHEEIILAYLFENQKKFFSTSFCDTILVVFVQMLGRLIAGELKVIVTFLARYLCQRKVDDDVSEGDELVHHEALFKVLSVLTDAHILLFPCNSAVLSSSHMLRMIQNYATTVKDLLAECNGPSPDFIVKIVCMVVRLSVALPDQCQTAPKLLILNLMKEFLNDTPSNNSSPKQTVLKAAIKMLHDDAFLVKVEQFMQ